jgi:hypothetical protein
VAEAVARDTFEALLWRMPGERLKQVVWLRALGLTRAEVGRRLGVTGQYVRQLLREAWRRARLGPDALG